jgi:hypothetical protein
VWLGGMGSWEKCNFDVAERCTLHTSRTMINEKKDFVNFSANFSIHLCEVIFKHLGGDPSCAFMHSKPLKVVVQGPV